MLPPERTEAIPDMDEPPVPKMEPILRRHMKKPDKPWLVLAFLVLAGVATGGAWYYLADQPTTGDGSNVPIIRADLGAVKKRPKEPGGLDVPNRDKLVYDRMQGGDAKPRVERLLPPPEQPLPPPTINLETAAGASGSQPPPPLTAAAPEKRATEGPAKPPAPSKTAPEEAIAAPEHVAAPDTPTTEEVLAAMNPPPPQGFAPDAKAGTRATPGGNKSGGKDYKVQLAAVRSLDRVDSEWKRLRRRNSDLLDGLSLAVTKADLGAQKGVFYRLRVGPLADEAAAQALCKKLAARKVGCLVVRPGQ